jgi:hypothetical protein
MAKTSGLTHRIRVIRYYLYIKSAVFGIEEWIVRKFEEIMSGGKEPALNVLVEQLAVKVLSRSSIIKRRAPL